MSVLSRVGADRRPLLCVAALMACMLAATAMPYTMTRAAFTDATDNAANTWETGEWLPEVSLTTPADGATVSGQVLLSAEVTGDPVDGVGFIVDGVTVCTAAPGEGAEWSCLWDSTVADNGGYALVAAVTAGQDVVESAPHTITVDNIEPQPAAVVWHAPATETPAGTSGTASVARPANVVDGDLVVLIVSNYDSHMPTAAGFTQIRTENRGGGDPRITGFWRIADGDPASYEIQGPGDAWHAAAVRVTGHHPGAPIGNDSGIAARSKPAVIPDLTTSADDVLLVAGVANRGKVVSYNPPSGMTQRYARTDASGGGGGTNLSAAGATETFASQGATGPRSYGWTEGGGSGQDRHAAIMFEILPGGPPPTPAGLTATSGEAGYVPVSWDAVTGAEDYDVRYREQGTSVWRAITAIDATSHDLSGVEGDVVYEIAVRARNPFGSGAWSAAVTATPATPPEPPAAPSDLLATPDGVEQVQLSWTDNADDELGFTIQRAPSGSQDWVEVAVKPADSTTHTDGSLTADTAYDYRVRAYNHGGGSAWVTVTATTAGCSTVGDVTLESAGDSLVLESLPETNFGGSSTNFGVRSSGTEGNGRSLVQFDPVSRPGGCPVTAATLRLHATATSTETRTLQALAAAAAWEESEVTWDLQPATSGDPVSTTSGAGWRTWDVTAIVGSDGTGGPHGFLLRDANEGAATTHDNAFSPREGANPPQLVLSFG